VELVNWKPALNVKKQKVGNGSGVRMMDIQKDILNVKVVELNSNA